MTVAELIENLRAIDPKAEVFLHDWTTNTRAPLRAVWWSGKSNLVDLEAEAAEE